MSLLSRLFIPSAEDEQAYHRFLVEGGYIEPTPTEARAMDEEDTANYVQNISAHTLRREWFYDSEGCRILHWEEYVIDQKGREHVVKSGQHNVGPWGYAGHDEPIETVQGEVVETPIHHSFLHSLLTRRS